MVMPERYRLILHPNLDEFTFRGEETIYLKILKPTKEITLHAVELGIEEAIFIRPGTAVVPENIHFDPHAETATFVFAKPLPAGKGELILKFQGVLNDQLRGFYRSRYTVNGKEKYLAATQLEATDARRAFPCFDEPSIKAVFDVTLMIPKGHTAISNTLPVKILEHESGYQVVKFAPTPKMSTYLLACVVGEFEFVEGKSAEGVVVRVFTTRGKRHQAAFALEVACRALSFYTKYFGVPYPLPVLDLVAIPDFAAQAMENWGAITYRESAVLIDSEHSSAADRQWVAIVVVHELAHQWFGNLVTMDWWTRLWLNESFARYMEYFVLDHLFPEWDMWTQFTHEVMGQALRQDSLRNVQAVETEVHHPSEIDEAFDPAISYSKGACIIRMLVGYIGEKAFQKGLKAYFKKHAFSNASAEDLWLAFETASGRPVRKIMDHWVKLPGHPLLNLRLARKGGAYLRQGRFFASEIERQKSRDGSLWKIPVQVKGHKSKVKGGIQLQVKGHKPKVPPSRKSTDGYSKDKIQLMRGREMKLVQGAEEAVSINQGAEGYFRVDYPAGYLHKLLLEVEAGNVPVAERVAIIRDVFALAESGQLPTREALKAVSYYKNETDFTVWSEIAENLARVYRNFAKSNVGPDLRAFAHKLFSPLVLKLGWKSLPGEGHTTTLLRELAILNAGLYGDKAVIREARRIFGKGFAGKLRINADLREVIYRIIASSGGVKEHQMFLKQYIATHMAEEKNRIGLALGSFRQKNLLRETLRFALSDKVRRQDAPFIVAEVAANPAGGILVWQMVRREWPELVWRYGLGSLLLTRMIRPLGNLNSRKVAGEINKFFRKHKSGGERTVAQVVERILGQDAWVARDRRRVGEYLKKVTRDKRQVT